MNDAERIAGIDIGSRSIELVVLHRQSVSFHARVSTAFDPKGQCESLLKEAEFDRIVATGYGRKLFASSFQGLGLPPSPRSRPMRSAQGISFLRLEPCPDQQHVHGVWMQEEVIVPGEPDMVGSLGAALHGQRGGPR